MIIIDTNALIEVAHGNEKIKEKMSLTINDDTLIALSSISKYEIYVGLGYTKEKLGEKTYITKKNAYEKVLDNFINLDVTSEIIVAAAEFRGKLLAHGINFDTIDFIIGTTARIYGAEYIITNNERHFKHFKIPLITYN